jgi:hypothetical protein
VRFYTPKADQNQLLKDKKSAGNRQSAKFSDKAGKFTSELPCLQVSFSQARRPVFSPASSGIKQTIMISPAQKLRYFITFFPAMKLIEGDHECRNFQLFNPLSVFTC